MGGWGTETDLYGCVCRDVVNGCFLVFLVGGGCFVRVILCLVALLDYKAEARHTQAGRILSSSIGSSYAWWHSSTTKPRPGTHRQGGLGQAWICVLATGAHNELQLSGHRSTCNSEPESFVDAHRKGLDNRPVVTGSCHGLLTLELIHKLPVPP